MKFFWCLLFGCCYFFAGAQQPGYTMHELRLPGEIAYNENQFSGLSIYNNKLFMLSESRLQQGFEAKLYALELEDLEKQLADSTVELPFKKYPIKNLDSLKIKMDAAGQAFEGLEAMVIENNTVYLSVETAPGASCCFLLKGVLTDSALMLNTGFLVALPEFTLANGLEVFNAGYEALVKQGDLFFAFFEYNYFTPQNFAKVFTRYSFTENSCLNNVPVNRVPFRITDITATGSNHFTALNFFFKGNEDSVYRVPPSDSLHFNLIKNGDEYVSYCRLIDLELQDTGFVWKPLWEFPLQYQSYNWEGIAAYKDGYFTANDKYGPRPTRSVLFYLEKK